MTIILNPLKTLCLEAYQFSGNLLNLLTIGNGVMYLIHPIKKYADTSKRIMNCTSISFTCDFGQYSLEHEFVSLSFYPEMIYEIPEGNKFFSSRQVLEIPNHFHCLVVTALILNNENYKLFIFKY